MRSNDAIFKEYIQEVTKEMNYAKKWIAQRTAELMRNKLIRVYESIIKDFYEYEPTSYRRHDDQDGVNLYRAVATEMKKGSFPPPHTTYVDGGIVLNADDMASYNYHVPAEDVLDYILDGVRFPGAERSVNGFYTIDHPPMTFTSCYEDGECSASGTPREVLNSVRDQLSEKYYLRAKEEAKRTLKLKYITID